MNSILFFVFFSAFSLSESLPLPLPCNTCGGKNKPLERSLGRSDPPIGPARRRSLEPPIYSSGRRRSLLPPQEVGRRRSLDIGSPCNPCQTSPVNYNYDWSNGRRRSLAPSPARRRSLAPSPARRRSLSPPCAPCGGVQPQSGRRRDLLPPQVGRRRSLDPSPCGGGQARSLNSGPPCGQSGRRRSLENNEIQEEDPIVVMKNIPMNPLSDPKKLNVDDIPLVPHNQIVYIQQPYLIVADTKQEKGKGKNSSTTEANGESTEGEGESTTGGAEGESTTAAEGEGESSTASTEGESTSSEGGSSTPTAVDA